MGYHVLSNEDMELILQAALFIGTFLIPLFSSSLGQRNAMPESKDKGLLRKAAPWIVFCIFISELSLLVFRCIDYPWDIDPQPSQSSIFREIRYVGSGYAIFGWANDYQLPVLSSLAACVMWLWWFVYALNYKPSDTSWWKKTLKVIAYLILSITILGFQLHEGRDLWWYVGIIAFIVILLWIAKVRPSKKENMISEEEVDIVVDMVEEATVGNKAEKKEDPSRFMPQSAVPMVSNAENDVDTSVSSKQDLIEENIVDNEATQPTNTAEIIDSIIEPTESSMDNQPIEKTIDEEMMYCKHCGKRIEVDSMFCKYCGKNLY